MAIGHQPLPPLWFGQRNADNVMKSPIALGNRGIHCICVAYLNDMGVGARKGKRIGPWMVSASADRPVMRRARPPFH